jgi:hypothetical protein
METIDFLPIVKAYPALSRTYGEVSCIAGVQFAKGAGLDPSELRWIRLYPVPFRDLEDRQKFAKYQPIRVKVEEHSGDTRPETRRPDRDSIEVLGPAIPPATTWQARRPFVEPLMADSMCAIQRQRELDRTSLGIFRPTHIKGLDIEPADVTKEKADIAQAWVAQGSLLGAASSEEKRAQMKALELIPWQFKLKYQCSDPDCKGNHRQSIIDWEIAQYFRRVHNAPNWEDLLRKRVLEDICGADRDTALLVGNQHLRPNAFLILGFWWPRRSPQQLTLG